MGKFLLEANVGRGLGALNGLNTKRLLERACSSSSNIIAERGRVSISSPPHNAVRAHQLPTWAAPGLLLGLADLRYSSFTLDYFLSIIFCPSFSARHFLSIIFCPSFSVDRFLSIIFVDHDVPTEVARSILGTHSERGQTKIFLVCFGLARASCLRAMRAYGTKSRTVLLTPMPRDSFRCTVEVSPCLVPVE